MTAYPVEKIQKDVRVALDQNMSSEALTEIGDVDTLAFDEIIRSKILEGVKRVHSSAPVYLLSGSKSFAGEITWKAMESGEIELPDDFMRFVAFEMSDWSRAVFAAISSDDDEYLRQSSKYKGIRGTAERPVCVLTIGNDGKRVLEFYSCKSEDATIERALYLPYPTHSSDGTIEICERCYDALIYTIAGLVTSTLGASEISNVCNELAKSSLI